VLVEGDEWAHVEAFDPDAGYWARRLRNSSTRRGDALPQLCAVRSRPRGDASGLGFSAVRRRAQTPTGGVFAAAAVVRVFVHRPAGRYYGYRLDAIEAFEIGADRVGDNEHRAAGARWHRPRPGSQERDLL
jgi:hypothetical protein